MDTVSLVKLTAGQIYAGIERMMQIADDTKKAFVHDKSAGTWSWFDRDEADNIDAQHPGFATFLDAVRDAVAPYYEAERTKEAAEWTAREVTVTVPPADVETLRPALLNALGVPEFTDEEDLAAWESLPDRVALRCWFPGRQQAEAAVARAEAAGLPIISAFLSAGY
jgi:hypothetical protein